MDGAISRDFVYLCDRPYSTDRWFCTGCTNHTGDTHTLWRLTRGIEGGISKRKLFTYLAGSKTGVAIELKKVTLVPGGVDPWVCLGRGFRPPQSFRYLSDKQVLQINLHGES
jgi:hypothetical protein